MHRKSSRDQPLPAVRRWRLLTECNGMVENSRSMVELRATLPAPPAVPPIHTPRSRCANGRLAILSHEILRELNPDRITLAELHSHTEALHEEKRGLHYQRLRMCVLLESLQEAQLTHSSGVLLSAVVVHHSAKRCEDARARLGTWAISSA